VSSLADTERVTDPAERSAPDVVSLDRVAARIGGRTIWSDVSLRVRAGEFAAVLGPNGVGKSTLLKAVLGVQPISAGELRVLGSRPGRHNSRVGYLPQRRAFDAATRIRGADIVRLGWDGDRWGTPLPSWTSSRRSQAARDRVREVIQLVGATSYANRPIGQCSGGEQQRLLIAQALDEGLTILTSDRAFEPYRVPVEWVV